MQEKKANSSNGWLERAAAAGIDAAAVPFSDLFVCLFLRYTAL